VPVLGYLVASAVALQALRSTCPLLMGNACSYRNALVAIGLITGDSTSAAMGVGARYFHAIVPVSASIAVTHPRQCSTGSCLPQLESYEPLQGLPVGAKHLRRTSGLFKIFAASF
jgi:hypothetical protein